MLLPGSFSAKIALSVMTKDQKAWNKFIICYLHQTADRKVFLALLKSFRTPWKARTSNLLNAVTKRQVYWCSHFSNFFCEVNPGVLTSPNSSASSCKFIDHCQGRFYSCYCIWELLHKNTECWSKTKWTSILCMRVHPVFMIYANSGSCSFCSPANRTLWTSSTATICMAVGKVSLEFWLMLACSLGCTGFLLPSWPVKFSISLLLMTSFMFIFVWVLDLHCHTTRGKWSF